MTVWRVLVYIQAHATTDLTNKKGNANKLQRVKKQNTKASEVGFRAEPLAKTPTFVAVALFVNICSLSSALAGLFFLPFLRKIFLIRANLAQFTS